jgi:catechol 2,3-dioxygenase-like lactoylglutathione lyase family enzyme
MRLRQIALAASDLDAVTHALTEVFGLKVAYNDPTIGHYGLRNVVLPAGDSFLEVVQPIVDDASAARFLARRGGDAGYMVILQAPDAEAERDRLAALGVRVVDGIETPDYRAAHFHPADFGGVLVSIDQQRTAADYLDSQGDWFPAGPDWRDARTGVVLGLTSITLDSPDPRSLAALWSRLLVTPLDPGDDLSLPLGRGRISFRPGAGALTSIACIALKVADADDVLDRARAQGLDVDEDGGVLIGGVRFGVLQ